MSLQALGEAFPFMYCINLRHEDSICYRMSFRFFNDYPLSGGPGACRGPCSNDFFRPGC